MTLLTIPVEIYHIYQNSNSVCMPIPATNCALWFHTLSNYFHQIGISRFEPLIHPGIIKKVVWFLRLIWVMILWNFLMLTGTHVTDRCVNQKSKIFKSIFKPSQFLTWCWGHYLLIFFPTMEYFGTLFDYHRDQLRLSHWLSLVYYLPEVKEKNFINDSGEAASFQKWMVPVYSSVRQQYTTCPGVW